MGRNSGGNNVSGVPSVKGGAKTLSQASNTLKTAIASGNKSAIDKATKQVDGIVSQMGHEEVRKHGMAFHNTKNKTEYTKAMDSVFAKHAKTYNKTRADLTSVWGSANVAGMKKKKKKRVGELVGSLNKKDAKSFLNSVKSNKTKTQREEETKQVIVGIIEKRLKRKK